MTPASSTPADRDPATADGQPTPPQRAALSAGWAGRAGQARRLLALAGLAAAAAAQAGMGVTELPARTADDGPVTVFYPTEAPEQALPRGPVTLVAAEEAPPAPGNGHLVMLSHGSGGGPWVHGDLARRLVAAGYVVAAPWHRADNMRDPSDPGPDSWTLRPGEVSRAIDAVAADPRWAGRLDVEHVGAYGVSAGGHTVLSLAGARWSPARFNRHCQASLRDDFSSCVGLITQLDGGPLDGLRCWLARTVIALRFGADERLRADADPRIAAVVAAVPSAADFEAGSLAAMAVPVALLTAGQDRWLVPRFHAERVLAACPACERLADLPDGGHGAYLSPLPPGLGGLLGQLLNDPPGFDRGPLPAIDDRVVAFFERHLRDRAAPSAAGPAVH